MPPFFPPKRMSPLQIDTSYGNTPTQVPIRSESFTEGQPSEPPPSPGFFIPTTAELTDQQKGYIRDIVHRLSTGKRSQLKLSLSFCLSLSLSQSLSPPVVSCVLFSAIFFIFLVFLFSFFSFLITENSTRPIAPETAVSGPQPFPLQDPANFRLKRQISTESSDSADIKFSSKGPTKRLNTSPKREHVRPEENDNKLLQKLDPLKLCSPAKTQISPPPYTATIQWVLKQEDPNPSTEEDFIPASKIIQNQQPEKTVMTTSTPNTEHQSRERNDSFSSKDFHQEMMGGFQGRGRDPTTTGTTTKSNNPMVTERGFVFPKVPSVSDPIPFSPRIVGNPPQFKARNPPPKNVLEYIKSELEKPPSLDDVSSDSVFGSSASPPEYRQNYIGLLRHKALRSFSDIERSPSKSETEEIQAILRELKRCLSDPTFTSPSQKAMLREERLVRGFFPSNDLSEEESPPDSFDHVEDHAHINAELRRMNSYMKSQLEAMKKHHAKRQLFSPLSSEGRKYTSLWFIANTTQMSNIPSTQDV